MNARQELRFTSASEVNVDFSVNSICQAVMCKKGPFGTGLFCGECVQLVTSCITFSTSQEYFLSLNWVMSKIEVFAPCLSVTSLVISAQESMPVV